MSDVAMFDDELRSLEDEIAACLRAVDTLGGDARMDKLNKAADLTKKFQKTFGQYRYELRMLEGSEQAVYEKKAQEHQQTIQKLKQQMTQKRSEAPPAGASNGGGAGSPRGGPGGGGDEPRGDGKDGARAATKRIANTQKGTLESLARTEEMINQSEDIGNQAANTLKNQTEQIKQANEKLDVIEGQVDKAKKELNAFIRRMMTDKLIICFAVLVVAAIIVIVVMKVKDGGKSDVSGTVAPVTFAPPTPLPPTPPTNQVSSSTGGGFSSSSSIGSSSSSSMGSSSSSASASGSSLAGSGS